MEAMARMKNNGVMGFNIYGWVWFPFSKTNMVLSFWATYSVKCVTCEYLHISQVVIHWHCKEIYSLRDFLTLQEASCGFPSSRPFLHTSIQNSKFWFYTCFGSFSFVPRIYGANRRGLFLTAMHAFNNTFNAHNFKGRLKTLFLVVRYSTTLGFMSFLNRSRHINQLWDLHWTKVW